MVDLEAPPSSAVVRQVNTPADGAIRTVLFISAFFLQWISLQPFLDLSVVPPPESLQGGDRFNQIAFASLFMAMVAWMLFNNVGQLKLVLRPTLIVMVIWFAFTVLMSWEPALSGRRLAFALIVMGIAGTTLLLPKNFRHFSDLLAAIVLVVLALCYVGVLVAPSVSIHQLTDILEPEHAGSWRGLFKHKNEAGGTMVIFVLIGLFIARARSLALGCLIVALASVFLILTYSKTSIALLPFVLLASALVLRWRTLALRLAVSFGGLVALNLLAIGSIYFEPIRAVLDVATSDPSLTGRTDIWEFALDQLAQHPVTGFGFAAFWGTDRVIHGLSESATWATAATDAHNAYLNIALATGLPGLALVIAWAVVSPLVDFHRLSVDEHGRLLSILFLRIWLFGIFASCFESVLFNSAGEVWFAVLIAILGLRMLSLCRPTP